MAAAAHLIMFFQCIHIEVLCHSSFDGPVAIDT